MSSPETLSPNKLNQALISETLSDFPHFEFVSTNTPAEREAQAGTGSVTAAVDALAVPPNRREQQQEQYLAAYNVDMEAGKLKPHSYCWTYTTIYARGGCVTYVYVSRFVSRRRRHHQGGARLPVRRGGTQHVNKWLETGHSSYPSARQPSTRTQRFQQL